MAFHSLHIFLFYALITGLIVRPTTTWHVAREQKIDKITCCDNKNKQLEFIFLVSAREIPTWTVCTHYDKFHIENVSITASSFLTRNFHRYYVREGTDANCCDGENKIPSVRTRKKMAKWIVYGDYLEREKKGQRVGRDLVRIFSIAWEGFDCAVEAGWDWAFKFKF